MSPHDTRVVTPAAAADDGAATVVRPVSVARRGIAAGSLLVNTYEVERLLGGGGMGEVYLAKHTGLGTRHAIKVIRPAMAMDRQVMDLFYREARVLRGVRHDAVVSYDGFVRDDQGRDYLVMEYVEGPSLVDRLRRGPLSPAEVLTLRDRLAAGLAEAHRCGAVHRDISPDNVILPGDRIEAAKLIDFGVCKLTDPTQETIIGSSFAGKFRYASPEQLGLFGGGVDARSDIYSLGLILAAAAQGRPLDMGDSIEGALRSRQSVPDLSGVPASLQDWLAAMLQPDPAGRPATMEALLERWPAAAGGGSLGSTHRSSKVTAARSDRGVRRGSMWAIGLVSLVGMAGVLYWMLRPLPVAEPGAGTATAAGTGEVEAIVGKDAEVEPGQIQREASQQVPATRGEGAPNASTVEEPARIEVPPDTGLGDVAEIAKEGSPPSEEKPPEREQVVPGARFADPLASGGSGPIMVWLSGGEFQMGSPPEEPGRNPDERLHPARVPEPLAVSETEITVRQFRQFVQATGYRTEVDRESTCLRPDDAWQQLVPDISLSWERPGYEVTDGHPVACINWSDARAYAEWLAQSTGRPYRLPTELEWEYAARAGTASSRFWGDDPKSGCTLANTAECKDTYTYAAPAGTFPPNPFGLRDVLGNLAEWTCSEYGKGYSGTEALCTETAGTSPRVFRGGSWLDAPELVRSAARDGAPANLGLNTVGFRVVRTLHLQTAGDEARVGNVAGRQ